MFTHFVHKNLYIAKFIFNYGNCLGSSVLCVFKDNFLGDWTQILDGKSVLFTNISASLKLVYFPLEGGSEATRGFTLYTILSDEKSSGIKHKIRRLMIRLRYRIEFVINSRPQAVILPIRIPFSGHNAGGCAI